MIKFFPALGKQSKNAVFETKIAMACFVNLPFLAVLMHLYYESPATIIGMWVLASFMHTGELYSLVLNAWIMQVLFTTEVLRILRILHLELENMDRALQSGGQTSVQTLHIDVTKRATVITGGEVVTQTEAPCTFKEYTAYVFYVMKRSSHFSKHEHWNPDEMNLWTARLVVLIHSKMHYHVCRMIAACAVTYVAYGAFHVEWRTLVSYGMAYFLNSNETTREDKPKVDPIAIQKLLICIKHGVCKPTDMTV